jgi:hypothetical protein
MGPRGSPRDGAGSGEQASPRDGAGSGEQASPRDGAGSGEKTARAARLALAGDLAGAEVAFRAAWATGDAAAGLGLLACLRARGATEKARAVLETLRARGVSDPALDALAGEVVAAAPALVPRGMRFDWAGEHLDLGCGACGHAFDVAVASWMAVLDAACPACGLAATFEPEALTGIAACFDPPIPAPVADTLDAATIRIVAGWHQEPAFAPVLDVAGMNVGALAEQMVFPLVLDAVLAAYRERP